MKNIILLSLFCSTTFIFAQKSTLWRLDLGVGKPFNMVKGEKLIDNQTSVNVNQFNAGLLRMGIALEIQHKKEKDFFEISINNAFFQRKAYLSNGAFLYQQQIFLGQLAGVKNLHLKKINKNLDFYLGTGVGFSYEKLKQNPILTTVSFPRTSQTFTFYTPLIPKIRYNWSDRLKLEAYFTLFSLNAGINHNIVQNPQISIENQTQNVPIFGFVWPKDIRFGIAYSFSK
jgi:hypothetical protein